METLSREIVEDEMRIGEDGLPSFFKIVYGEDIRRHLRIPPAFVKNLTGDISGSATLTHSSGGPWAVGVRTDPSGTYLEDGWEQFMRENGLGDNEFLVFRYDGNMQFHVKIFEKNGLKRLSRAGIGTRPPSPSSTPKSFTSSFPYFQTSLTKSTVHPSFVLSMPRSFSNAHLPARKIGVTLRNWAGKEWEVTCSYTGRHRICGGWGAFVRDNNLQLGDSCIFELVESNVMQVHVL